MKDVASLPHEPAVSKATGIKRISLHLYSVCTLGTIGFYVNRIAREGIGRVQTYDICLRLGRHVAGIRRRRRAPQAPPHVRSRNKHTEILSNLTTDDRRRPTANYPAWSGSCARFVLTVRSRGGYMIVRPRMRREKHCC
ncbi:hypothetical protein EVAR_27279_1 [Eumeta japonica]|uniref:Uncharacterized protein n=1 Tax=Eumeta variegata TaxID=151549 RepID=A0A4C1W0E0_EUMVA|nr:hypothetical protein EVAR_27279_1 [Eumeta japonica]